MLGVKLTQFVIRKGTSRLPLFWSVDGWQSSSYWAIKYPSKEAAKKAFKLIDTKPGDTIYVEEHAK